MSEVMFRANRGLMCSILKACCSRATFKQQSVKTTTLEFNSRAVRAVLSTPEFVATSPAGALCRPR